MVQTVTFLFRISQLASLVKNSTQGRNSSLVSVSQVKSIILGPIKLCGDLVQMAQEGLLSFSVDLRRLDLEHRAARSILIFPGSNKSLISWVVGQHFAFGGCRHWPQVSFSHHSHKSCSEWTHCAEKWQLWNSEDSLELEAQRKLITQF